MRGIPACCGISTSTPDSGRGCQRQHSAHLPRFGRQSTQRGFPWGRQPVLDASQGPECASRRRSSVRLRSCLPGVHDETTRPHHRRVAPGSRGHREGARLRCPSNRGNDPPARKPEPRGRRPRIAQAGATPDESLIGRSSGSLELVDGSKPGNEAVPNCQTLGTPPAVSHVTSASTASMRAISRARSSSRWNRADSRLL